MATIEHLQQLIRLELNRCQGDLWPEVCRLQQSPEGYERIEKQLVHLALTEGMPVGAGIAQLEQELSHNQS